MEEQTNSKRIAKNTLMLYIRQILIMLVSLYTVRVVLNVLGTEDYGIYNVVAGVVTMFGFLSASLASSFQRYLTFDIAQKNDDRLKETFALGLGVFILLGICIFFMLQTVGLWFVISKLVIPTNRLFAAICVYEASIISFVVILFLAPYQAILLADENMSIYAYASIIEALLKLIIVYVLKIVSFDKLAAYGFILLIVPFANVVMYVGYCLKKYSCTHTKPRWIWNRQKEIVSYTSWNLLGAMAGSIRNQGINIVINLFYGPLVNAARGIASQVNNALMSFSSNFSTALRPQIIKYYALNEKDECMNLVFSGCKLCFYLLWVLSLPLLINMNYVLSVWLKNVPDYAIIFTQLVIVDSLIECLSYPLIALMHANGRIKEYQITIGTISLLNIPISYLCLKIGLDVTYTMIIAIVLSVVAILARLLILHILTGLDIFAFFKKVIVSIFFVVIPSGLCSYLFIHFVFKEKNLFLFILDTLISMIFVCTFILIFGISKKERYIFFEKIKVRICRRRI